MFMFVFMNMSMSMNIMNIMNINILSMNIINMNIMDMNKRRRETSWRYPFKISLSELFTCFLMLQIERRDAGIPIKSSV
jgi:hypothetical protein